MSVVHASVRLFQALSLKLIVGTMLMVVPALFLIYLALA